MEYKTYETKEPIISMHVQFLIVGNHGLVNKFYLRGS